MQTSSLSSIANKDLKKINETLKQIQADINSIIPDDTPKKPLQFQLLNEPRIPQKNRSLSPRREELYGSDDELKIKNQELENRIKNVKSSGYGQQPKEEKAPSMFDYNPLKELHKKLKEKKDQIDTTGHGI